MSYLALLSALWDPSWLGAKLKHWWRADYGVTKDGSNRVSQWAAYYGGKVLVQATGAKQPLFESGMWGGLPTITSDSSSCNMRTSTNLSITRPYTVGLLASGSQDGMLYELSDNAVVNATGGSWVNGNSAPGVANLGTSSGATWSYWNYTGGSPCDAVSPTVISKGFPKPILHNCGSTHATHNLMMNGRTWALTVGSGNNPGAIASTGPLNIFSRADGNFPGLGRCEEIVIAEGLTAAEQSELNKYLQRRGQLVKPATQCWLGDSIMGNQGFNPEPTSIRQLVYPRGTDCRVVDLSVYGETLVQQKARWDQAWGSLKYFSGCENVLIEAMANDIGATSDSTTVLNRLQALIDDVHASNSTATIVVVKCIPFSTINESVRVAVNTGIDSLTHVDRIVSSHLATMDNGDGSTKSIYRLPGDVHLNLLGLGVMRDAFINDALQSLGLMAA
jgi:hypothetical protein